MASFAVRLNSKKETLPKFYKITKYLLETKLVMEDFEAICWRVNFITDPRTHSKLIFKACTSFKTWKNFSILPLKQSPKKFNFIIIPFRVIHRPSTYVNTNTCEEFEISTHQMQ